MGVGGTAALGAALHARALGLDVTGCDHDLSEESAALLAGAGVEFIDGEGTNHLGDRTLLAVRSEEHTSELQSH